MQIKVDEKTIYIDDAHWTVAQAIADTMMDTLEIKTNQDEDKVLFYLCLIAMYKKSTELLNALGVEELKAVLDTNYEGTANSSVQKQ